MGSGRERAWGVEMHIELWFGRRRLSLCGSSGLEGEVLMGGQNMGGDWRVRGRKGGWDAGGGRPGSAVG